MTVWEQSLKFSVFRGKKTDGRLDINVRILYFIVKKLMDGSLGIVFKILCSVVK